MLVCLNTLLDHAKGVVEIKIFSVQFLKSVLRSDGDNNGYRKIHFYLFKRRTYALSWQELWVPHFVEAHRCRRIAPQFDITSHGLHIRNEILVYVCLLNKN